MPPFKDPTAGFHLEQLDQFIVVPRGHAHGWLRVAVRDLETSWIRRLTWGNAPYVLHEERPRGSGIYHYMALKQFREPAGRAGEYNLAGTGGLRTPSFEGQKAFPFL